MNQVATTLEVRTPVPGVSVIELSGDVTRESDSALTDAYQRAGEGARTIILAFDKLDYMNSSGIGLLVTLLVRAQRSHQAILACGLTDHYRQIFELTRLDDVISIYDTEDAALSAVV
jgi:anti-anti-sigma factor